MTIKIKLPKNLVGHQGSEFSCPRVTFVIVFPWEMFEDKVIKKSILLVDILQNVMRDKNILKLE